MCLASAEGAGNTLVVQAEIISSLPVKTASSRWLTQCWMGLLLIGTVAHFAYASYRVIAEPHALNYTEGISLLSAQRIHEGAPMYPPIGEPPYVYLAYPPVYPLLCAGLTLLGTPKLPTLRGFTVACELLSAVLLFLLLRQRRVSRLHAATCGASLLGILSIHKFHGLARLDMLVVALLLLVLWLLTRARAKPNWRTHLLLGASMVLTCLTKPTAAVPLLVMGGSLLLPAWRGEKRARRILGTCVAAAATYVAIALALQHASGGGFVRHTFLYQAQSGVRGGGFATGPMVRMWQTLAPVLIATLACFALIRRLTLPGTLALVSLLWLALSSLKAGADLNYTLEPLAWLLLFLGCVLGSERESLSPRNRLGRRIAARRATLPIVLGACLLTLAIPRTLGSQHALYLEPALSSEWAAMRERTVEFLRESDGLTLAEEPYFAVAAHKALWLSDPFHYEVLRRRGTFDFEPIYDAMRAGRIRRIVAGARLLTVPNFAHLLHRHYRKHAVGLAMDEDTALSLWTWAR